jgi:hypothetical protein
MKNEINVSVYLYDIENKHEILFRESTVTVADVYAYQPITIQIPLFDLEKVNLEERVFYLILGKFIIETKVYWRFIGIFKLSAYSRKTYGNYCGSSEFEIRK